MKLPIGPGIPSERRDRLFCKYQESLDSLRQGTGVGLYLCANLVDMMGGSIRLDDDYHDTTMEGFPGTRFVVDLKIPPLKVDEVSIETKDTTSASVDAAVSTDNCSVGDEVQQPSPSIPPSTMPQELPNQLSVLVVDDDMILRK